VKREEYLKPYSTLIFVDVVIQISVAFNGFGLGGGHKDPTHTQPSHLLDSDYGMLTVLRYSVQGMYCTYISEKRKEKKTFMSLTQVGI
jgi:hypothetical protein